jgi:hypothetical protein
MSDGPAREYGRRTYRALTEIAFKNITARECQEPINPRTVITTLIAPFDINTLSERQHILAFDCDGDDGLCQVKKFLYGMEIEYASIQSSPGHWWIICDKIIKNLGHESSLFQLAPGTDKRHVKMAAENGVIVFRGWPKHKSSIDYRPQFETHYFQNDAVGEWYADLHDYFNSDFYSELVEIRRKRIFEDAEKEETLEDAQSALMAVPVNPNQTISSNGIYVPAAGYIPTAVVNTPTPGFWASTLTATTTASTAKTWPSASTASTVSPDPFNW